MWSCSACFPASPVEDMRCNLAQTAAFMQLVDNLPGSAHACVLTGAWPGAFMQLVDNLPGSAHACVLAGAWPGTARSQLHAHDFAGRRRHLHQHVCKPRSRQLALCLLHRAHLLDGARQRTCEEPLELLMFDFTQQSR